MAYVCNSGDNTVTPITLATNTPEIDIPEGGRPFAIAITPDQAPTARFTTVVDDLTVTFDGSTSSSPVGTIAKYDWDFGDGHTESHTAPTATVTHTYSSVGTFTVTLTVTNTSGTSTEQTFTGQTVSNNGGPSAVFSEAITTLSPAPLPPPKFMGKVKKNTDKKKLYVKTKWSPSSSSGVVKYQIFAGGMKIKTISSTHHRKATIHLHPHHFFHHISKEYRHYLNNKYKIRAVSSNATVSSFTHLKTIK
jgi:PKD repeat protein